MFASNNTDNLPNRGAYSVPTSRSLGHYTHRLIFHKRAPNPFLRQTSFHVDTELFNNLMLCLTNVSDNQWLRRRAREVPRRGCPACRNGVYTR